MGTYGAQKGEENRLKNYNLILRTSCYVLFSVFNKELIISHCQKLKTTLIIQNK